MNTKEEFELAIKAFLLMTTQEQGIVLMLFQNNKLNTNMIESFIDSVHKVIKPLIHQDE